MYNFQKLKLFRMRMQHVQLSSDDLIKAANIFMKNMNLEKPFPLD
jgi:hypothetical protein